MWTISSIYKYQILKKKKKKIAILYLQGVSTEAKKNKQAQNKQQNVSTQMRVLQSVPQQPRSGELRTQKLKSHMVRTRSLNVLPLKPGVDHYIVIRATLTAKDFFLAYFYPSGPFTYIFSKTSLIFSCVGCG